MHVNTQHRMNCTSTAIPIPMTAIPRDISLLWYGKGNDDDVIIFQQVSRTVPFWMDFARWMVSLYLACVSSQFSASFTSGKHCCYMLELFEWFYAVHRLPQTLQHYAPNVFYKLQSALLQPNTAFICFRLVTLVLVAWRMQNVHILYPLLIRRNNPEALG